MKNAPLVEIIAELRWGEAVIGKPPTISFGGDETLYVRLGIEVGKIGYDRLERLQPEGMPFQSGAVVYRYRRGDEKQNSLYQAGPGIFTANGLPPYSSWRDFEPDIRAGLEALWSVKTFPAGEKFSLVLRYVDAFDDSHMSGLTKQAFIEAVVGVAYAPVPAITKFVNNGSPRAIRFSATHEAVSGELVTIELGQGYKDGVEVLLLNTSTMLTELDAANIEDVMNAYGRLQGVLHDAFMEMIKRSPEVSANLLRNQEGGSL